MQPGNKSNAGTIAAVLGGLAAVGGIAAAAFAGSGGGKKTHNLGSARRSYKAPALKKPCGCGR